MMYWLSHCTLMISMTIGVIRFQLVGCEKVFCFHFKRSWGKVQIDLFYPKTSSVPKTIVRITEVLVLFLSCSQFVSMHHLHAKYTKTLQLSKPTALSTMASRVLVEANGTQRGDTLQMDQVHRWWPSLLPLGHDLKENSQKEHCDCLVDYDSEILNCTIATNGHNTWIMDILDPSTIVTSKIRDGGLGWCCHKLRKDTHNTEKNCCIYMCKKQNEEENVLQGHLFIYLNGNGKAWSDM